MLNGTEPSLTGDRRSPWVILGSTWLIAFSLSTMMQCPSPLLPMLIDELGLTHWQVGMLYAAPVAIITLFSYPVGIFSDRVGIEKAVALGSIIAAASTILRGFCSSYAILTAVTVSFGFGFTLGLTNLSKIVKTHFQSALAGTATGIYATGMPLGSATSIAVTKPLLSLLEARWPAAFWTWGLFGMVPLLVWLITCFLTRRPVKPQAATTSSERSGKPHWRGTDDDRRFHHGMTGLPCSENLGCGPLETPLEAGSHRRILISSLVVSGILLSLLNLLFFCTVGWLPTYLEENGFGPTSAALLTSMIPFIEIPAVVLVPLASDRTGRKRELLAASYLAMAVGSALLAVNPPSILVAIVILGITFGGSFALLMATPAELSGIRRERTAQTAGALLSIGYLGALAGPPVAGRLRDVTGDFTYSFLFLAAAAAAAAFLCYWLPSRSPPPRPTPETSRNSSEVTRPES